MDNSPTGTLTEAGSSLSSLSLPIFSSSSTLANQANSLDHLETATQKGNAHVKATPVPTRKANKHSNRRRIARPYRRPTPPISRQPRSSVANMNGNSVDQRRARAASINLAALSMDPIRSNEIQGEGDCQETCCLCRCLRRHLRLKLFITGVICLLVGGLAGTVFELAGLALGVLLIGILVWFLLCGIVICQCCDLILTTLIMKALKAADEKRKKEEEAEKGEKDEKEMGQQSRRSRRSQDLIKTV